MSEREANERRKIKRGSISGLADTTMKVAASQEGQEPDPDDASAKDAVPQQADASQEGQGPDGKQPDPDDAPAKDTVPQQADASQEGQGPDGKEPDPDDASAKDAVPQPADASQEGQGPDGKQPDPNIPAKDAVPQQADDSARVKELVELLKRAIDSDQNDEEGSAALIRNLSERKLLFLRDGAWKLARTEAEDKKAIKHFTDRAVKFHESLTRTLKESNSDKALEAVRETQGKIVREYWDRFVKEVNAMYQKKLQDSKRRLQADLHGASNDFSEEINKIFNSAMSGLRVGSLRHRLFREWRLLTYALVLGLVLGSFFGIKGETLWNNAVAASREVFSGFGPAVIPLADRSGQ